MAPADTENGLNITHDCKSVKHRCICGTVAANEQNACISSNHKCVCHIGLTARKCLSARWHRCIKYEKDDVDVVNAAGTVNTTGTANTVNTTNITGTPKHSCDMIHLHARLRLLIVLKNNQYAFVQPSEREIIVKYL